MKSRTKKLLAYSGLLVVVGFLVPHFVHGAWFDSLANPSMFWVWPIQLVGFMLYSILGLIIQFGGWLIGVALKLNMGVTTDPLVSVGWTISRDIANLGFVLVMIVVAFATIVNNQQYGYKKLLANLIIAAILVNFSLAIAGVFIDFSHVLTNFFLSKMTDKTIGLPERLAAAMKPQNLIMGDISDPLPPDPSQQTGALTDFGQAALQPILELGFIIAFSAVTAVVFLTIAVMFIIRYVYLAFLLLVAPLAWLFWIVPGYSGTFSTWWSKFMQQTLFAPAVTFALYLALASNDALGEFLKKMDPGTAFKAGALQSIMQQGAHMVILTGIIIGGLILANHMGAVGAKQGLGAVKGIWTGAKQWGSANARWAGQRIAQSRVGAVAAKHLQLLGEKTRTNSVAKVLTLGANAKLARGLERAGAGIATEAAAPKREFEGAFSAMGMLGGGAGMGAGIFAKPKEKKEEDKSKGELLAERGELVRRKESMKKSGFDLETMRKLDNQIKGVEGALDKKYDIGKLEGDKMRGEKAWQERIGALNEEMTGIKSKGGDTSYHEQAIIGAKKKMHEELDETTTEDKTVKMKKFEELRDEEMQKFETKIAAESDPDKKRALEGARDKEADYYKKEIVKVESKIEPKTEDEFKQKKARIQSHRETLLKQGGVDTHGVPKADTSSLDATLKKIDRDLDKLYETETNRPVQIALEKLVRQLRTEKDGQIASGAYVTTSGLRHPHDSAIEKAEEQAKVWSILSSRKLPKSKTGWIERKTELENAKSSTAALTRVDLATGAIVPAVDPATQAVIDKLIREADDEIARHP